VDDLRFDKLSDGVFKARCRNDYCGLEEILSITARRGKAEIMFSAMFSDFNLLFLGSDILEEVLKSFGEKVVEAVLGKGFKTRVLIK